MLIYATATDDVNVDVQQMRSSKMYMHEIQRFGGKLAVVFEELTQWLGGLWHGVNLAITVAWLSVATALVLFLLARMQGEKRE